MPKTKDAFAFAELYCSCVVFSVQGEEEILPNYNSDGRNSTSLDDEQRYYNSDSFRIEEALLTYLDGYNEVENFDAVYSEIERTQKKKLLTERRGLKAHEVINRIDRHLVRLHKYSRLVFDEILSADETNFSLKGKGIRAKKLISRYEYLQELFEGYLEILRTDWKKNHDLFLQACRKVFGNRLRQARIEKNISAADMAAKLHLSRAGYGNYELGKRDLPTPKIYQLAQILDVSLDWLFGLKD